MYISLVPAGLIIVNLVAGRCALQVKLMWASLISAFVHFLQCCFIDYVQQAACLDCAVVRTATIHSAYDRTAKAREDSIHPAMAHGFVLLMCGTLA